MSYYKQHEIFKESLELDYTIDETAKVQYNIYGIDDMTNRENRTCGNLLGMCCNRHAMQQDEIL